MENTAPLLASSKIIPVAKRLLKPFKSKTSTIALYLSALCLINARPSFKSNLMKMCYVCQFVFFLGDFVQHIFSSSHNSNFKQISEKLLVFDPNSIVFRWRFTIKRHKTLINWSDILWLNCGFIAFRVDGSGKGRRGSPVGGKRLRMIINRPLTDNTQSKMTFRSAMFPIPIAISIDCRHNSWLLIHTKKTVCNANVGIQTEKNF